VGAVGNAQIYYSMSRRQIYFLKQIIHIEPFGFEELKHKSIYLALKNLTEMMRHSNK
jgi:flagellar biosynthesis regulator FlbT